MAIGVIQYVNMKTLIITFLTIFRWPPRFNDLVSLVYQLMKIAKRMLGKRLFKSLMKATFYGQFVAGEDQAEIKPVIEKMRTFGVKSILDYSAEEDISSQEATERMT